LLDVVILFLKVWMLGRAVPEKEKEKKEKKTQKEET